MRAFLKIKIKSLAAEASIIRKSEIKHRDAIRNATSRQVPYSRVVKHDTIRESLYLHRTKDVRSEARSAQLAYGLLRGLSYLQLESSCKVTPSSRRIAELIVKYGNVHKEKALPMVTLWLKGGQVIF